MEESIMNRRKKHAQLSEFWRRFRKNKAAVLGLVLLVLIIKFKLHPVLSMMISAIIIGAGAGMPLTMISDTVEKGVGKT